MPPKLDRCVKKVRTKAKKKGKKVNPWAVCNASLSGRPKAKAKPTVKLKPKVKCKSKRG